MKRRRFSKGGFINQENVNSKPKEYIKFIKDPEYYNFSIPFETKGGFATGGMIYAIKMPRKSFEYKTIKFTYYLN